MNYEGLHRVISGGQTGSDQGGLAAAKVMRVETGGTAPKGYRTSAGLDSSLGTKYNLVESDSHGFERRTEQNVFDSDATIRLASDFQSPGEVMTEKYVLKHGRPMHDVKLPVPKDRFTESVAETVEWIIGNQVAVLNVAGNRDKAGTMHFDETAIYMCAVLGELRHRGKLIEEEKR